MLSWFAVKISKRHFFLIIRTYIHCDSLDKYSIKKNICGLIYNRLVVSYMI